MEYLCRDKLGTLFYLVKLGFTFSKSRLFEMLLLMFASVKMQTGLVRYAAACLSVINRS